MTDIVIVGGGPAGATAAIYAARAGRSVKIYEKENIGGQIVSSPMVDNYPGLPHLNGAAWAEKLEGQLQELSVEIIYDEVTGIDIDGDPQDPKAFFVKSGSGREKCAAVILATGVKHRSLGLAGEEAFEGCGISYCAVCDGAFYKDLPVAVVGGGDSALQEALYLASVCSEVHLIHRRERFRGEKRLAQRVINNPKIKIHYNKTADHLLEDKGQLTGICLKDVNTGELTELSLSGIFPAVGLIPQSDAFQGLIDMDDAGYYFVGEDALTNVPGILAAGDARIKMVRQLTTAVGDGAAAAVAACGHLDSRQTM